MIHHLEFYTVEELKTIILRSACIFWMWRSTRPEPWSWRNGPEERPVWPIGCLKRVRDFAQVKYEGKIDQKVAVFALDLLEVDTCGLDQVDRRLLLTLIEKFNGGPVGLDTLAAAIGEDSGTIEDVYEPYLIQNGFLNRTPRGRMATELAYQHLGM